MKRLVGFLMILLLLLGSMPVLAAETATVTASAETAEVGETVTVHVSVSGNPGLAAWLFTLRWDDDALSLVSDSVAKGTAFSSGTILSAAQEGQVKVTWYATKDVTGDGEMFTVQFLVKEGASGTCLVTLECSAENTINTKEERVAVTTVNGSIMAPTLQLETPTTPETPAMPQQPTNPEVPIIPITPEQPEEPTTPKPPKIPETTPVFKDVTAGAYYYDAVSWAVARKITSGTAATLFAPDTSCTRAQVMTFLWRAADCPEPLGIGGGFADVPADAYYADAVQWAVENGITQGTSRTSFSPDAAVTRGQVVTFLWRSADTVKAENAVSFSDVPADAYYADAVAWTVERGVTLGTGEHTFNPDAPCTRAQIVTFLYRYFVN